MEAFLLWGHTSALCGLERPPLAFEIRVETESFQQVAHLCVENFVANIPFPKSINKKNKVTQWQRALQNRNQNCKFHKTIVAHTNNQTSNLLIGCLEIGLLPPPPTRPGADVPYLANVATATHARRRGVAQALLENAEAHCIACGFSDVYCKVSRSNIPARRLYDKLGYKPIFLQQTKPNWNNQQESYLFLHKCVGEE